MTVLRAPALLVVAGAVAALASTAAATPPVAAQAYYVQSGVDGTILAQLAAAEPRAIASITKLMTVIVALQHLKLNDVVTVPRLATRVGEASVPLRSGERIKEIIVTGDLAAVRLANQQPGAELGGLSGALRQAQGPLSFQCLAPATPNPGAAHHDGRHAPGSRQASVLKLAGQRHEALSFGVLAGVARPTKPRKSIL